MNVAYQASMNNSMNKSTFLVSDTAETVNISALALLKMLKHGRAGVPLEVMGLMLGKIVDEYTIEVVDVFAMPQSGTGVSVEAVDEVYQTELMTKLKQTGRQESVVGWYHSHPGFGCWLSSVDVNTALSFEKLDKRSVSVVIDPIQSVKGKIVIDAFRTIPQQAMESSKTYARQTTSNIGFLNKPSLKALMRGLNRSYYSINVGYQKNELVEEMLLNLRRVQWHQQFFHGNYGKSKVINETRMTALTQLATQFSKDILQEDKQGQKDFKLKLTGKKDCKKHLNLESSVSMTENIKSVLETMLAIVIFE